MKKISYFILSSLAAFAMLVATPSVQADNLLVNGGFESEIGIGSDPNGMPQNWYTFVGGGPVGSGLSTLNPLFGLQNGQSNIAGEANSFTGMQQIVLGVTPGLEYTFSVWAASTDSAGNPGSLGVDPEFRIEFIETAGFTEVGRVNGDITTTPVVQTYQQYTVTGLAPAGADALKAVVVAASFGGAQDGGISWDQARVGIPEPGSLALIGMGALGLVVRRRRR